MSQHFRRGNFSKNSWDVWHLHWPEHLINRPHQATNVSKLVKFWIKLKLARFNKIKIFWTVHNLRPHERNHTLVERIFWNLFLPNVDGIICMSELGKKQLIIEHSRAQSIPIFVIPHGHYRGAYPDFIDRDKAREALKLSPREFVVTFFGQIRAYKGVTRLIRCFVQAQISNTRLLIAGKPIDNAIMKEIKEAVATNPNVTLFLDFVDNNDIQNFLRATDLVILPYTEILNSGSALLALSFDRPILVPAIGSMAELRDSIGQDWVRLYDGELSAETISSAIQWAKARQVGQNDHAPLEALDWDHIADLTIKAITSH